MLYLIGTGLSSKDISLNSLEIIKRSKKVYLEIYTSKLEKQLKELEKSYQVKIHPASRNLLENTNEIVEESLENDVVLLVIGTPLFATTHTDIILRVKEKKGLVKVVHNSSILNVYGCCGLYSYTFGKIISIPFFENSWKPTSFYFNILSNKNINLHTLCLLDLRITEENELYMSPNIALDQLLQCESIEKKGLITLDTEVFVISRFGCENEEICYGKIGEMIKKDFGEPLHSLIIPGKMDVLEKEHVEMLFKK
ncbi:diphthine synthase [Tubulinosema ratisbonensis]|uniref:diphthine methyl ester synthase n=1 Tax=Tubulinosema ratisbonensis TaxID=291195 RepID=A0A437AHX4_9MICR|nr:diphthine synthase [Tubulinosema ratisbonensis]